MVGKNFTILPCFYFSGKSLQLRRCMLYYIRMGICNDWNVEFTIGQIRITGKALELL